MSTDYVKGAADAFCKSRGLGDVDRALLEGMIQSCLNEAAREAPPGSMQRIENDYHALALEHGKALRQLEDRSTELRQARQAVQLGELRKGYRRRITRLQALIMERKTPGGWVRAKWRRAVRR